MRRLTTHTDGERGGIAVIVAVLMVVLLGFAAISIDVAKLHSERAQLQNGADAAALMVAQKCAKNEADTNCSATSSMAPELANKNALDSLSNIKAIALDKPGRTVQVTAGAKEAGTTTNSVSTFFAGIFGIPSSEVSAFSSARWGSPIEGPTPFPLAFSICQVSTAADKNPQLLEGHDPSANGDKGTPDCIYAGQPVPGGFNWTQQVVGECGSSIDLSVSTSRSETGNDAPENCGPTLDTWAQSIVANKDVVVLLPVFDKATGTGSTATYHLTAFASFKVLGWKFGGADKLPLVFRNQPASGSGPSCTGSCRGIIGSFVEYVSLADGYKLGPVSATGATVVELTK
ncbi:pilus assembly protein TadG-related protein [Arthrobacter sp. Z1-9]